MFNKNVTDVLSQINGITNSVILKYPVTVATSESQDVMVYFDVSKMDSEEFNEVGLKDNLNEFLSLIKLFPDNRKIEIEGKNVNISSEKTSSTYITDVVAMMDAYNKSPEQFDKTEAVPSVASFEITSEDIKNIKSATGVFKDLSEVIFVSQDGDIRMSLGATNKFNAKSNTYSVVKSAQTTKEFEIKIPVDNFKMIPQSNYTVEVKYNSARNSYRILMINQNIDGFKLLLSVKI